MFSEKPIVAFTNRDGIHTRLLYVRLSLFSSHVLVLIPGLLISCFGLNPWTFNLMFWS